MSDVTLTEVERAELERAVYDGIGSVDTEERNNVLGDLGDAVEAILAARLSQEREQVSAERDREWAPGVGVWEALADEYERRRDNLRRRSEADSRRTADCMDRREANTWDVAASEIRGRLAQDGPRPAQEGEQ